MFYPDSLIQNEGSYLDKIVYYMENNKGKEFAIMCHPDNKDKFNIDLLKSIEVITDVSYELDGFMIGDKESILEIKKNIPSSFK